MEKIHEFYCNLSAFYWKEAVPPGHGKVICKLRIKKRFWSKILNENLTVDAVEMKF